MDDFHKVMKRGKPYTYPYCKHCHRKYVKDHYELNRKIYIDRAVRRNKEIRAALRGYLADYLAEHPCVDCGETDIVVLHFDHVDGEKSAAIADMVRACRPLAVVTAEITKCVVRCANCHQRKTAASFGWWRITPS